MFQRGVAVNAVAIHTALLGATLDHISCIGVDVTVCGVEGAVVGALEIDFEVGKQIVSDHEVIRIGQSGGLGTSAAQMTLSAGGNDFAWITRAFSSQQSQLGVGGVLFLDISVAGIAIESERRKGVGFRVDGCGVASGALSGEDIRLPGLAIFCQDGKFAITNQLERMEMLGTANDMGCVSSRFRDGGGNAYFPDGPCMWLLLPRGADHTLMAKQALIAGHVVRQRLAYMVVTNL